MSQAFGFGRGGGGGGHTFRTQYQPKYHSHVFLRRTLCIVLLQSVNESQMNYCVVLLNKLC